MYLSNQYEMLWKTGDPELGQKILHKDVSYIFNLIKIHGREALLSHILERKKDFEVSYEIAEICTNQSLEYHYWQAKAFLNHSFEGLLPTHKEIIYSGITLLQTENGLITQIKMYSDITDIIENFGSQAKTKKVSHI